MTPTIHILWPTARLDAFRRRLATWFENDLSTWRIVFEVAVNTQAEADEISGWPEWKMYLEHGAFRVHVTGTEPRGPVAAVSKLCRKLEGGEGDVVILATDDFSPPLGWDQYIVDRIGYPNICAALMVNDGVRGRADRIMTLPIMTWSCFLKINRLIVHPDYVWHYADAELYENLAALDLLRDARGPDQPVFEHQHWTIKKRARDGVDKIARRNHLADKKAFRRRMAMSVEKRLEPICDGTI